MVKGAWFATAVQPLILLLGAVLSALDSDVLDVQPIIWRNEKELPDNKERTRAEADDNNDLDPDWEEKLKREI